MNEAELSLEIASRIQASGLAPAIDRLRSELPGCAWYLYGGAVRDAVLGRTPSGVFDLDVLVDTPDVSAAAAALAGHGNIQYGAWGNLLFEPSPGGAGILDLQSIARINNSLWPCEEIRDVQRGVDLTVNSIAYDLRSGAIVDPQNGVRDANRRMARAVRFDFSDEPVGGLSLPFRAVIWTRVLHYSAMLDLEVEPLTSAWLLEHRRYLQFREAFAGHFFEPELGLLSELG